MNKWALLVGVNKYAKLANRYQLHGCVADVELMANILRTNFGFPKSHITLLRDEKATREGILASMKQLDGKVGQGDVVVLHYSGHGSQMTDREGDEPDGMDETIVPHDSGRGLDPNRDITDDEIYAWLLGLTRKTPCVTLIFDSCHSGTISRDAFGGRDRWLEPDTRPVAELPPSPFSGRLSPSAGKDVGASDWVPLGEKYVLIAGCRDEESSFEHSLEGGQLTHGALTYFLCQELVKAKPGSTYRDVFEPVAARVAAAHPRQHPQMEGARDRELFGVKDVRPMRFVQVKARWGDEVTLAAGAAHGMTRRSHWAIHQQGAKTVADQTPRLGLVEITAVRATSSDARIIDEAHSGAVVENSRAVEQDHFYGEMRLVVDVEVRPPSDAGLRTKAGELMELIAKSDLLRLAGEEESGDARVYLIAARTKVQKDDPLPQLGRLAESIWAVVGTDGRLMMPLHGMTEPEVAATLRDNLEKAVRYRQALALRNASESSILKGKVGFWLRRQSAGGGWEDAHAEDNGGLAAFEEGDRIAARITNRHTAPVFVSVLDFGLAGAIGLLHPVEGASERLSPGQSIEIGVRDGDEIGLYLPGNFPYAPDPEDAKAKKPSVGGTETFKLYATTHEADFSQLMQEGYRDLVTRSAVGAGTPLGQLLDMALTGFGTREAKRTKVAPDEEWTTAECSFTLRKKGL